MLEYISFGLLALVLGFKHSYDADHIVAVSNILKNSKSVKNAFKISMSWAAGHMITAALVTTALFAFKDSFLPIFLGHFEKIVGFMLIALGIYSIHSTFRMHSHEHSHNGILHRHFHLHKKAEEHRHYHKHMLGIGIIHGLASNDELLMLFTASLGITTLGGIIAGIGIFSIGVVLGMLLFAAMFTYPLIKCSSAKLYRAISFLTGGTSVAYGIYMVMAVW